MVSLIAFLRGLPNGVMKRGVRIRGVLRLVPPGVRRGDRVREGEWNCEGGSDTIGGVGATDIGRGVIGAEFTESVSPWAG